MPFAWRDTMSMAETDLDHQHKLIIQSLNALDKANRDREAAAVHMLFAKLLPYLKKHFEEEEAYFERIRYPRRYGHKQLHAELLRAAGDIHRHFMQATDDAGRFAAAADLQAFLKDYLFRHVAKEDMAARQAAKPDRSSEQSMMELNRQSEEMRAQRLQKRNSDIEYQLPAHLEHLLKRIEFVAPGMPPKAGEFPSFQALCDSAIFRRLDEVLLFFQRSNPDLRRELPPFFLSSPKFREKFQAAIRKFVLPSLWDSRQVRLAAASLDLDKIDNENFWTSIEATLRAEIMYGWRLSWAEMRPVAGKKTEDGRTVLKIKDNLKQLREALQPDDPADYDLPKIGQRELDVFSSLLDVETDWRKKLDLSWTIFVDLYEQEKDPRVFQQRAREGALRDFMLESFSKFPTEWLDFILLCCHANFPRVTSMFLDSFSRNYAARETTLPFTMRYLEQVALHPEIRHREVQSEDVYQRQREELGKIFTKSNE